MVKTIEDSQSRKERTKSFLEYLYAEDNLHWFEEGLEIHNKYILQELQLHRRHVGFTTQDLKLAFMSAYDVITEDLEPLQLAKHLCSSFRQQSDFSFLRHISTRQGRASFFFRKILTMSDQRFGEVLEAMRISYNDIVSTVEEILKCGSLCEKYKCPRIRRCHGKIQECVFSTEISLFDADTNIRTVKPCDVSSPKRLRKTKLAAGFVQAEITKYDKKKEYWSSYDRYNTNIGVIGSQASGSCKRSLLNAMCGRIETDEETAQVYVETDLHKFSSYKEARNIVFWDLPEIGTGQYPRETYLKDIDFKRYDCFALLVPCPIALDDNILKKLFICTEESFWYALIKVIYMSPVHLMKLLHTVVVLET
ncbi:uncharacterized protein LOC123525006 [Mercenaria mercenaria]|uniref:uncharacterized protein LOC123525006 n=1 Tax=Mercenaria mercenaria TaxID=6596 RepID=UPI00234E656F|nr:uncharacterized protein LOC123525006 [Mercenaria mercenaria]XP_053394240.1 uncharacterized protein LOC123525006 [Mercenaria mercenaria]